MTPRFRKAVLVSLALHAAILAAVMARFHRPPTQAATEARTDPSRSSHPMRVRMLGVAPLVTATPALEPLLSVGPTRGLPTRRRLSPSPAIQAAENPCVGPGCAAPTVPSITSVEASSSDVVAAAAAQAQAQATAAGGSGGALGGGASGSVEPRSQELHRRLAAAAARCYPSAAKRFRTRGEVMLGFCLDEAGHSRDIEVRASSQSALLDVAATDCVLPGALPFLNAAGCYTLPVRFGD